MNRGNRDGAATSGLDFAVWCYLLLFAIHSDFLCLRLFKFTLVRVVKCEKCCRDCLVMKYLTGASLIWRFGWSNVVLIELSGVALS